MTGKQNTVFFLGVALILVGFGFGGQFTQLWSIIKTPPQGPGQGAIEAGPGQVSVLPFWRGIGGAGIGTRAGGHRTGTLLNAPRVGAVSPAKAKAYAKQLMPSFGWGSGQFPFLNKLWTRESGWRWNATNPNSGAYGIPQNIQGPGGYPAGGRTSVSIQEIWGMRYIQRRYGNPQAAWAHEQQFGWY